MRIKKILRVLKQLLMTLNIAITIKSEIHFTKTSMQQEFKKDQF